MSTGQAGRQNDYIESVSCHTMCQEHLGSSIQRRLFILYTVFLSFCPLYDNNEDWVFYYINMSVLWLYTHISNIDFAQLC
jgi:hypothetical protein